MNNRLAYKTFFQIMQSTCIWGTIGLLTVLIIKSFYFNACFTLIIFLVSRLILLFHSTQQNPSEDFLGHYYKLLNFILWAVGGSFIYVVIILSMDNPPNLLIVKLIYSLLLLGLFFYTPILICHFLYYYYLKNNYNFSPEVVLSLPQAPSSQHKPISSEGSQPELATSVFFTKVESYITDTKTKLLKCHIALLQHLLEILKEIHIAQQQRILSTEKFTDLQLLQQKHFANIQKDIKQFLIYPPETRQRYDRSLQAIPDLWLTKQLQHNIEQLIQNIAFLYENNLQVFLDHQTFLEQKFQDQPEDFDIIKPKDTHK